MEWIKKIPIQEAGQSARGEEEGLGEVVLLEPELAEEINVMYSVYLGLRLRSFIEAFLS